MSRAILGVRHAAPGFAVPAGACDCHVHVFGPAGRYPFAAARAYTPPDAPLADLRALHAALGIERVVIVHPSPYGADNACTLDALRAIGPAARGVAVIDAATTEAALREMHAAGVRGVRVNLETAGVTDPRAALAGVEAAARRVAPLGWHVQVFTRPAVIVALETVLADLPVPLVIDHFGHLRAERGLEQPGAEALLRMLASGRAWVKVSAAQRVSDRPDCADCLPLARAMIEANPERVVWGSDWPHPRGGHGERAPTEIEPFNPVDDGAALARLAAWAGSERTLARILVDNPARLYGF